MNLLLLRGTLTRPNFVQDAFCLSSVKISYFFISLFVFRNFLLSCFPSLSCFRRYYIKEAACSQRDT